MCVCAPPPPQTDDMVWSYVVKGAPPEYKTPQVATKIDNKMDPAIVSKMTSHAAESKSRNIMRENMVIAGRTSQKSVGTQQSVVSLGSTPAKSVTSKK